MKTCEQPGCDREGAECFLDAWDDEPNGVYCPEHSAANGFCAVCGLFWGGIESFEFLHPGVCDHCHYQLEADNDDGEEFEEECGEYGYDVECE
jgi:hypothetical protein